MRLDGRESSNVEDQRSSGGGRRAGIGLGGAAVVVVVGLLLGKSPLEILSFLASAGGGTSTAPAQVAPDDDRSAQFVSRVLADTEDTWGELFRAQGKAYAQPKLVLFRGGVDSACGFAEAAVGPFYCPGDHKVYLDLSFFDELHARFGAPGDFAQAYVVAHEIGHHVQKLLGASDRVDAARARGSARDQNAASVLLELQADCYAGVWGGSAQRRGVLEAGDVEEALRAAQSIGDDTLQQQAGRSVRPDAFTHGTSAQRQKWLKAGLSNGSIAACDTFAAGP